MEPQVTITIPGEFIEAVAQRVVEMLCEQPLAQRYLDSETAAAYLGIPAKTLKTKEWRDENTVPYGYIGGRLLFDRLALDERFASNTGTAAGTHHLKVDGGEQEALLVQADLRSKKSRGLRVTPLPTTFGQDAEKWFTRGCVRWAPSTQAGYRTSLDLHVLPVFGDLPVGAITTDMAAAFVADRRAADAEEGYIDKNLRPLHGTFKLAVRDGLISSNPMDALLSEERPKPKRRKRRTWTPADVTALVDAARELGSRVGNVFDYTPI